MSGCGFPANMHGLFDRPMVMGTAGKIFFGRDENNIDGSLSSQGASFALLARVARKTLRSQDHKVRPSKPHKEKAPAMMGDRGRRWGAMGEMPIFILECLKRIGTGLAKTLIIFLRNAARFWETV